MSFGLARRSGYGVNVIPGKNGEYNYLELVKDGVIVPSGKEKEDILRKMGYIG